MTAEAQSEPRQVTFLEAIRDGAVRGDARDASVFVLGEDIGAYGGAFKVTEGLLEEFGARARHRHPDLRGRDRRRGRGGRGHDGLRPVAEMQFIDFISCAFDQLTNFVAKCRYRWGAACPMVVRGPCGGGVHGGPVPLRQPGDVLHAHARDSRSSSRRPPTTPRGCSRRRSATTTRCSSSSTSTSIAARSRRSCRTRTTSCRSARRRCAAQGKDLTHRHLRRDGLPRARGGRATRRGWRLASRSSTCARSLPSTTRPCSDSVQKTVELHRAARGDAHRRHRRRDRRPHRREGVRVPRRARSCASRRPTRRCLTARRSRTPSMPQGGRTSSRAAREDSRRY